MKRKAKRVAGSTKPLSEAQIAQELAPWPAARAELPMAAAMTAAAVLSEAIAIGVTPSPAPPADVVITQLVPPVAWFSAHKWLGRRWRELKIGTRVLVQRSDGSVLETVTTSTPADLGGQPVVECDGIAGPYHLRNIFLRGGQ